MYCQSCGQPLNEGARFCTACGARVPAPQTEPAATKEYGVEPTKEYGNEPTKEYGPDPFRTPTVPEPDAAQAAFAEKEELTVLEDGIRATPPRADGNTESLDPNALSASDPSARLPAERPADYNDSFEMRERPRFSDSGWRDPNRSKRRQYRPTTAGQKAASVLLCLLMLLFGFSAMLIGASRIAFSESNVRRAYQKGTLADLKIDTSEGEKPLSELLMENMVDSQTNLLIPLEEKAVEQFLRGSLINNFAENLAVDFTQFFIFGRTPSLLNGSAITAFFSSISADIEDEIAYSMSDEDIEDIGWRVDGGDLSFLSIDENGGYFKQKYGVDPYLFSSFFSVWMLAICAGLVLVCIVLVFLINRSNTPAGFSYNSGAMITFGVLNTLIAAALLILSYIKNIFLLSELMRSFAFAMGAVSIVVLFIGIVFAVIKNTLRNRIY